MSRTFLSVAAVAGLLASAASPAMSAYITFDHRENLNVLNSPDVTITASEYYASSNSSGSELRGTAGETSSSGIGWFAFFPTTNKEVFKIDLGAVRNLETFRLTATVNGGVRNILTGTIETSSDGITWSAPLAHATNYFSHTLTNDETRFTLNSAVETRWVRITGDSYSYEDTINHNYHIGMQNMAIYGAAGTVDADSGLDLVASTAWTAGNATISTIGGSYAGSWLTEMADDNETPPGRQLIYNMNDGASVTATFAQTVDNIKRVGFSAHNGFDLNMHFRFLGSTDGINFSTVLLDQTGGLVKGPNFFNLATAFTGNAVRFEIVDTAFDSHMVDMFVFQVEPLPEPGSLALIGVAAIGLASRRRERR